MNTLDKWHCMKSEKNSANRPEDGMIQKENPI